MIFSTIGMLKSSEPWLVNIRSNTALPFGFTQWDAAPEPKKEKYSIIGNGESWKSIFLDYNSLFPEVSFKNTLHISTVKVIISSVSKMFWGPVLSIFLAAYVTEERNCFTLLLCCRTVMLNFFTIWTLFLSCL